MNKQTNIATQADKPATIILSKGGTKQRTVKLETLHIPDVWSAPDGPQDVWQARINECWHTAHDLKRHALELARQNQELLKAVNSFLNRDIGDEAYTQCEYEARQLLNKLKKGEL